MDEGQGRQIVIQTTKNERVRCLVGMKRVFNGVVMSMVILSFAALLLGAAPQTVQPSIGEMKAGVYTNKYFDLKLEVPKGMTYISKKEIEAQLNAAYEKMLKLGAATKEEVELTKQRQMIMFIIQNGSHVLNALCADKECMEGQNLHDYVKQVSESSKEEYESMGFEVIENPIISKMKLGKYEYESIELRLKYGKQSFKVCVYFRLKGNYLLMMTGVYTSDDAVQQIIKSFK